jgi:hypothetical protein
VNKAAALALILPLIGSCAHDTFNAERSARICPLVVAWQRGGPAQEEGVPWALLETMRWEALPARGICGMRRHTLVAAGFSADGTYAGLEWGWQAAPLMGEGGRCLLRRDGDVWRVLQCEVEWVS